MEIDDVTPAVEIEGERKVWIQDDEEFRHWPFARWANVDVLNSPKLTRLFADLTLETKDVKDDIELLMLPPPRIKPTTSGAREFINCSELTKIYPEDEAFPILWDDEASISDSEDTARCTSGAEKTVTESVQIRQYRHVFS